ncbi:NUDIX domain-containing protein [Candidatus Micrarchaeota archaeon]|nr:NUDIX domain-containing protein [Candidatus Micrarchaeota archaeon]
MNNENKVDLVVAGLIISDNKVLLIHHRKLDRWIPPGGHIDPNETPDGALRREIKEELGMEIEILNRNDIALGGNIVEQLAVPFYANVHSVGDHDHCCFFYLCKPKTETMEINERELKDFKWFTLEQLNDERVPSDVRNISKKAFESLNK